MNMLNVLSHQSPAANPPVENQNVPLAGLASSADQRRTEDELRVRLAMKSTMQNAIAASKRRGSNRYRVPFCQEVFEHPVNFPVTIGKPK